MSGHKRVWARTCLGTNVCGHSRVVHSRVGRIMYGQKRVGTNWTDVGWTDMNGNFRDVIHTGTS